MSTVQVNKSLNKKSDIVFFVLSLAAVVLALYFVPQWISELGVSFLAAGSGLNKLLSVLISAGLGILLLMPSGFYKRTMELSKGAKNEWRKTVKPGRDEVVKTTMMVLAIVVAAAIMIVVMDWFLFWLFRGFLG